MVTTLTHPDLVRSLVVVDIAPKDYGDLDRFVHYIEAMQALPLGELTGRADAEERFAEVEPDPGVPGLPPPEPPPPRRRRGRGRRTSSCSPRDAARGATRGSPTSRTPAPRPTTARSCGSSAATRATSTRTGTERCAPCSRGPASVTVKGVGHWVHSEAPEVVTETLASRAAAGRPTAPDG